MAGVRRRREAVGERTLIVETRRCEIVLIRQLIGKRDGMRWVLPASKGRLRMARRTGRRVLSTLMSARIGRLMRVELGVVHIGQGGMIDGEERKG